MNDDQPEDTPIASPEAAEPLFAEPGASLGWLLGGLVPADFAPRTAAGVAGLIALGAGSDALSTLASRSVAILAATVATTLVLWLVWPEPASGAEPDPGG